MDSIPKALRIGCDKETYRARAINFKNACLRFRGMDLNRDFAKDGALLISGDDHVKIAPPRRDANPLHSERFKHGSRMIPRTSVLAACFLALVLGYSFPAQARAPKKYQVTGKVLEVTQDYIAVDKAGERWELGRGSETKITGKLVVGATVTIEYQMTARSVDVKDKK